MHQRTLGQTGLPVSPIAFGAFKIGRNRNNKYPQPYDLPDETTACRLLNAVLDMGVTYIDTAPAYGLSEERIGRAVSHRRNEFVLSTKVGETFADGQSRYDYSANAVRDSIHRSLGLLQTDVLDLVYIHSQGDDAAILDETDVVDSLLNLKQQGLVKAIGMSGKTVEGARQSLAWADVVMLEYHLDDRSHEIVIAEAAAQGVGVVVKKGLAAGHLSPGEAIRFVLVNPQVDSLIIGGLNAQHIRSNVAVSATVLADTGD
jgi:aryl-alcohol dehydrogenase-like predicted oxidoreductase